MTDRSEKTQSNGRGRGRRDYAEAGRAQRQALDRAATAGCTAAEIATLTGVFYFTSSYSRLSDHVSTGQVATAIGLWTGDAKDCPKHIRRKIALRLERLHEVGAIVYEPGGTKGQSHASTLSIPPCLGDPTEVPPRESHRDPLNGGKGTPNGHLGDPSEVPGGIPQGSPGGIPQGSPPGEYSGENPRGVLPERASERAQIERLTASTAALTHAIAEQLGRTPDEWADHLDTATDCTTTILARHRPGPDELDHLAQHIATYRPYGTDETLEMASIVIENLREDAEA